MLINGEQVTLAHEGGEAIEDDALEDDVEVLLECERIVLTCMVTTIAR